MDAPLVLVHGFLGGSAQWQGQVEALGARRRLIALDLPGFGAASERQAPDRIGEFADWALGELDRAGVTRFDLLGHSMGGMIVQEMAYRDPSRVRRLVLYGTGPVGQLPGRFETLEESRQRVRREGPAATAEHIAAAWFVAGSSAAGYPLCCELGRRASEASMLAGLTAMEHWDGRSHLARLHMPTLVLWGDRDRSYPWSQPEQLWQGIPDTALAVLPGCSHIAHLEKPALFNALLEDFLD